MAVRIDKEQFSRGRDGRIRWQVRYLASSRTEAISGLPSTFSGLPLTGSSGSPWISDDDGQYLVDATYEGLGEDPPEDLDQYEITGELREEKIETFSNREGLQKEFGAQENGAGLTFPATMQNQNKIGSGLTLDTYAGKEKPNPFFNCTTYPVQYEVAVHRFVRKRVPVNLLKRAGTLVERLPAGFQYAGKTKQWFIRPIQRRKVGNMWEITVEYQEVTTDMAYLEALLTLKKKQSESGSVLDTFFG